MKLELSASRNNELSHLQKGSILQVNNDKAITHCQEVHLQQDSSCQSGGPHIENGLRHAAMVSYGVDATTEYDEDYVNRLGCPQAKLAITNSWRVLRVTYSTDTQRNPGALWLRGHE